MKNLSCQITSPSFLDESFTTHIEIFTGKMFYHSEIGEFIASLPYQVADEIQRSVWRYIFSNKVLAIRKPLYFDWDDNTICHQDINQYIEGHIKYVENLLEGNDTYGLTLIERKYSQIRNEQLGPLRATGDEWWDKNDKINCAEKEEIWAMKRSRYKTLRNLNHSNILQSDTKYGIHAPCHPKTARGGTSLEMDCEVIKSRMIHNTTFPRKMENIMMLSHRCPRSTYIGRKQVCQCISKTGCLCGGNTENDQHGYNFKIPKQLLEKYAPLSGYAGIDEPCRYSTRHQSIHGRESDLCLVMCSRHQKQWEKELDGAVRYHLVHLYWQAEIDIDDDGINIETGESGDYLINKFERLLDLHLEQHNYHYKHGCWTKGDPLEGYTYDNSRKKPKKIPYEQRTVCMCHIYKIDECGWPNGRGDYYRSFNARDRHVKKKKKTMYLPKFSKTLDNNYQDQRLPHIKYGEW